MARKPKAQDPLDILEAKFESACRELWVEYQPVFSNAIDDSEKKRINLNFVATIDLSEAAPAMTVTLSFRDKTVEKGMDVTKTFKSPADRTQLEDPNQGQLDVEE
jgi:hypothetical protein